MINIEVFAAEAKQMLRKAQLATMPQYAARPITEGLRAKFHEQQREAFTRGGTDDAWPELSDWSVRVRGNAEPILIRTGSFQQQVAAFRGLLVEAFDGFDFIYPGPAETDGRYYGITAGQKANPLAARSRRPGPRGGTSGSNDSPMPQPPRPILFGEARIAVDANEVLHAFYASAGFAMAGGVE